LAGFFLRISGRDNMYMKYILKELIRRKSKTSTIVLTVGIITAMLLLFSGVMNSYAQGIYQPFRDIGSDIILQKRANLSSQVGSGIRTPFGKGFFSENEIIRLSRIYHVKNISASLIVWDLGKKGFTTVEGITANSFMGNKLSSELKVGEFLSDGGKILLESHFANFNHLGPGDNFQINNESFKVTGILSIEDEGQVFASNAYATIQDTQRLINIEGYNQIYLKIDELSNEEQVKQEIERLNKDITITSANSISSTLSNVVNIYNRFHFIGTGIIILIVILILLKVNTISLLERKKDIGVMRSVGWTKKDITRQVTAELLIQTIFGFIIGVVASFAIIGLFGHINIQASGLGLEESAFSIPITISPITIFEYFLIIILLSIFVSFLLAQKISEIKPSENLRSL
jgi:ABC-type lipoprotein release transport system permease subunit